MKLTNTACKNAKPKEKVYKLTDGAGLFLQVMPNGSKYWRFKYRFGGKEKNLAMGVYPEITLQMAREKRLEARRLVAEGLDSSQEKKKRKQQLALDASNTFKVIAEEWVKQHEGTWTDSQGYFRLDRFNSAIMGKRYHNMAYIRLYSRAVCHNLAHKRAFGRAVFYALSSALYIA